ncbi:MAG: YiiX/YebB-like N1pC/P60 family cysteine hydrolase [Bacteroidia bacterium]|jgi:hypothetical protein
MKKLILLYCLLWFTSVQAQTNYRNGDLLFQDLDCGALCNAIEAVTEGAEGKDYSHVGLVYRMYDSVFIIEALGKGVQLTPLNTFLARSTKPVLHARLKDTFNALIPPAIEYCLQQIGTAYDEAFIFNNGKYYCSELIYDAFRIANHYAEVFELESMTFKLSGSEQFDPVWVEYYRKLEIPIPQGEPGINPGSMSRSEKLIILN